MYSIYLAELVLLSSTQEQAWNEFPSYLSNNESPSNTVSLENVSATTSRLSLRQRCSALEINNFCFIYLFGARARGVTSLLGRR